jgi:nucleotide-binding universal stress UspA family protein
MSEPLYYDPAWDEEARASAERYVTSLAARLGRAGVTAEAQAVIVDPVSGICAAAEAQDVDLVIMSTHAHTGLAKAVLGSTTDGVVREAGRPVLVIPPGVRAAFQAVPREPVQAAG